MLIKIDFKLEVLRINCLKYWTSIIIDDLTTSFRGRKDYLMKIICREFTVIGIKFSFRVQEVKYFKEPWWTPSHCPR